MSPRQAFRVSGALPATSGQWARLIAALRSLSSSLPQFSHENVRSASARVALQLPHLEHVFELAKSRSARISFAPYQRHL